MKNTLSISSPSVFLPSLAMMTLSMTAEAQTKPNYLVILADDLGYGDISCHGGATPTPNIDKLFKQGVEFSNFMTCPVSSPTRAGLLTGLNPIRTGQGPNTDGQLDTAHPTLGSVFQKNGYTTGIFGKWHNGDAPGFFPGLPSVNDYGFNRFIGFYGGGCDYYTKIWANKPIRPDWYHDKVEAITEFEYSTDLLTRYALDFIAQNKTKQFMTYVPLNIIHTPLHVKDIDLKRVPTSIIQAAGGTLKTWKEYYKLYNDGETPAMNTMYAKLTGDSTIFSITGSISPAERQILYSAMLINLDDKVGEMMAYLDANGLTNNTVVLFFSDNGATPDGRALPFSGYKHSTLEGGVHSPALIRWPNGGLVGPKKFDPMVGYLDVLPTFMEIGGIQSTAAGVIDGRSFLKELKSNATSGKREYCWLWRDHDVIRTDNWKMTRYSKNHTPTAELYAIKTDTAELSDVATANPAVVADLTARLEKWRDSTGVAMAHLAPKMNLLVNPAPSFVMSSNAVLKVSAPNCVVDATHPEQIIQISTTGYSMLPGDYLHFDLMTELGTSASGFYITPYFGTAKFFSLSRGVDQFGGVQVMGPATQSKGGAWEHRVIGVGNEAPGILSKFSIVLKKSGNYSILIDNIQIRRADGTVLNVWNSNANVSKTAPSLVLSSNAIYSLAATYYEPVISGTEELTFDDGVKVLTGTSELTVCSTGREIKRCSVYSIDEKLIAQSTPLASSCAFEKSFFAPGVYIVVVEIAGKRYNKKVIIY